MSFLPSTESTQSLFYRFRQNRLTYNELQILWQCCLKEVHITDLAAWCKISFKSYSSNPLENAQKLYINGQETKDLIIPEDVDSIGNYAFFGCNALTSVTIPNSVISIGDWAFRGCI